MVLKTSVGDYQKERFGNISGQCDLIRKNGIYYLVVTSNKPDKPEYKPQGVLGIDLGVENIALAVENIAVVVDFAIIDPYIPCRSILLVKLNYILFFFFPVHIRYRSQVLLFIYNKSLIAFFTCFHLLRVCLLLLPSYFHLLSAATSVTTGIKLFVRYLDFKEITVD